MGIWNLWATCWGNGPVHVAGRSCTGLPSRSQICLGVYCDTDLSWVQVSDQPWVAGRDVMFLCPSQGWAGGAGREEVWGGQYLLQGAEV